MSADNINRTVLTDPSSSVAPSLAPRKPYPRLNPLNHQSPLKNFFY